ncbi:hypothetical protein WOLCODRAFT_151744 [Wolfiporia cocos MD-104 SS10]|uniref:Uncharacterized protein n=1 Tax=Wolfiporia cocos (strain MD-104) TaxID=742152 RepID=A0A2H3JP62_WOLCO|nr:hypothetical protein WOLCODRAFT_151744 [Wolfiporia cocos MD-104 SS10]
MIAKATRRKPKSNGSADCLNNRATPSTDRALYWTRSRHAARQQGSPGGGHWQSPPSKAYPGTVRIANGTGTQAQRYRAPALCLLDTSHRRHKPQPLRARRINATAMPPPLRSTPTPPTAGCIRRNKAPPPSGVPGASAALSTPLDSDAVTASQAKAAARETSQRRTQQEKSKKANLWELNAHVGLGQPRTRHHAQSGRPGHLSDTVPLA